MQAKVIAFLCAVAQSPHFAWLPAGCAVVEDMQCKGHHVTFQD